MKAFVTGSTGLLGSNLVQQLRAAGWEVRALARSPQKAAQIIRDPGVEIINGDMEDVAGFAPALAGCDVLFHTAAYFRESFAFGDHWPKLEQINVQGTIQLLTAAEAAGVKKAIYVSSGGVIGATPDGRPGDETTPPDAGALSNLYFKSKVVAEQAVAQFLKTHTLPVVLILPSAIFGPSDTAPTNSGKLILEYLAGKLPAIPQGGFSVVDVRDVAAMMITAVERGRSGERYIISDRYYSIGEILKILERVTGVPAPRLPLPYPMALAYGWFAELSARMNGSEPVATVSAIRLLNTRRDVVAEKARRELGMTLRPFDQTLRDAVQWFVANGYVTGANVVALSASA